MTLISAIARDVGQRLWTQASNLSRTPEERATLAEEAFARLERALVRWIGADGYHVLLERALEHARDGSPALANVRSEHGTVTGIAATVRNSEGDAGEVMVALLSQIVGLLSRIVGQEVAVRLIEQAWYPGPRPSGSNYDDDNSSNNNANNGGTRDD